MMENIMASYNSQLNELCNSYLTLYSFDSVVF